MLLQIMLCLFQKQKLASKRLLIPSSLQCNCRANNCYVWLTLAALIHSWTVLYSLNCKVFVSSPPSTVKVAGGSQLTSSAQLLNCSWVTSGSEFQTDFKFLSLGVYDGILGVDWLSIHSPMQVDWSQKWLSFMYKGELVLLQGLLPHDTTFAVVSLSALIPADTDPIPVEVKSVLDQFEVVFSILEGLPPRRYCDHQIPLIPGARPVTVRPYRVAPHLKTELEKQVAELLEQGLIRVSTRAFSSPVLLVRKKDGTWRLVLDHRHMNAITVKSKFPIPAIDELLDELAGASWFSKFDLKAGYHQIQFSPGEEFKTAFSTHNGHYEFLVLSMGFTGGPNTFQGAMNYTLSPVLRVCALVFFDDILVYSKTFLDHLSHLKQVLQLLAESEWKVKMSKCAFAQRKIAFLGHVISEEGVATDDTKIVTVQQWPTPTNVKEVRGFLGLTGYYRKFIRHYAIISKPLTTLLKKGVPFIWTTMAEEAFMVLKQALVQAPVLALPDFNKPFVIETDACDVGVGAVLMQDDHPLAFISKALGPRTQTLPVYEKEYLAILLEVEQWRPYLLVKEFIIKTDQKSLVHLNNQRLHTAWQHKALTKLMGLSYTLVYKKGSDNSAADSLSRRPHDCPELLSLVHVQSDWLSEIIAS